MRLTTLAAFEAPAASSFATFMDHVAQAFEVLGTLILVIGVLWAFVLAVLAWRQSGSGQRAYKVLRQAFGGTLVRPGDPGGSRFDQDHRSFPTLDNLLGLGLIVLIRTFLQLLPGDRD